MWKTTVEPVKPQMTKWRARTACWITKAADTDPAYVTLTAFPLQQWLHEGAATCALYVPCLFSYIFQTCRRVWNMSIIKPSSLFPTTPVAGSVFSSYPTSRSNTPCCHFISIANAHWLTSLQTCNKLCDRSGHTGRSIYNSALRPHSVLIYFIQVSQCFLIIKPPPPLNAASVV
jgi:hypothetical protein